MILTENVEESPYTYEQVLTAVDDYVDKWEDPIGWTVDDLTIEFFGKTHEETQATGCLGGWAYAPRDYIYVGYKTDVPYPLWKTALWHELTHVVLYWTEGDADIDHELGDGPWLDEHNEIIQNLRIDYQLRNSEETSEVVVIN
jgi:hypothetical protein